MTVLKLFPQTKLCHYSLPFFTAMTSVLNVSALCSFSALVCSFICAQYVALLMDSACMNNIVYVLAAQSSQCVVINQQLDIL